MEQERDGRVRIALVGVDAAALALWLWVLNRVVFHHPLTGSDYAWVLGLALATGTVTQRYAGRPARLHRIILGMIAGQILLAAALCLVRATGALHLSPRQALKLAALELPLLGLLRWIDGRCRCQHPAHPFESIRLFLATAGGFLLAGVFVTDGWIGAGDAYWYDNILADFVSQWRAGIFPVFAGQSEFAFNGAVSPLRFAPYFQHFAGVLDLITCHALGFFALQNLTLALTVAAGGLSAYLCAAAILPGYRWTALALAWLYVASPGVLALLYTGTLFMSVMTLPYLPMAAYGLWRWWAKPPVGGKRRPLADAAWLALPLAATWWCHPPIALWLTGAVASLAAVRVALGWRDPQIWRATALAAGFFGLAAGYVFVSVATLATPPTPAIDRTAIIGSIEAAVPGSFLPVSPSVVQISDYQLGWSLWLVILFAAVLGAVRPTRKLAALLGATGILLLFLLPVPEITRWLWQSALPQVVCDITFSWAAQRFYVILAAFGLVTGAAAFAVSAPRRWWQRALLAAGLAGALAWSGREAAKFIRHGAASAQSEEQARLTHGIQNIYLTRYSFNIFLPVPAYYSHGYVDPYLENRVLGPDGRAVLVSNLTSVRPPDHFASVPLVADYNATYHFARLSPGFTLAPGVRYAARIDLNMPAASAVLVAQGLRTFRQYFLPDSSFGMVHQVPTHSFGYLPTSSDFFPIWTSPLPDQIALLYAFNDPAPASMPANFGRLYLKPYAVEDLPIKISSWIPYRATLRSPIAGAWLETPRIYLPGYAAQVNDHPARLMRSPDGLVAIALDPGENRVQLRYPGPWLLQASYWIALLTWAAVALAAGRAYLGGNPSRRSIT